MMYLSFRIEHLPMFRLIWVLLPQQQQHQLQMKATREPWMLILQHCQMMLSKRSMRQVKGKRNISHDWKRD